MTNRWSKVVLCIVAGLVAAGGYFFFTGLNYLAAVLFFIASATIVAGILWILNTHRKKDEKERRP